MTLSALLIILFFLPGFIFNLAYYNSESFPLNISLTHKAIASLFITLILHTAGLTILIYCLGITVNFNLFLILFSGSQADFVSSIANGTIMLVIFYLIFLYFIAFSSGTLLRWGIKKYRLDTYSFLRIDNPWYDLFKGLDWKENTRPDGVKIAATMEIAGNSFLYIGILENFFFNKEGDIDRLVLSATSRRYINNDKGSLNGSERFYPIDGHCFVLKYSEIKNLNVEYLHITQEQQNEMSIQSVIREE